MKKDRIVNIKGNDYMTVVGRVELLHEEQSKITGSIDNKKFSIVTEVLSHSPVVVKATVTCNRGTFTGISMANPQKPREKEFPYEVAETSAIGRAIGFANIGILDTIASADEMMRVHSNGEKSHSGIIEENDPDFAPHPAVATPPQQTSPKSHIMATAKQIGYIGNMMKAQGIEPEAVYAKYGISSRNELTGVQASELITQLQNHAFQP